MSAGARSTDPETSHRAARSVQMRSGTQKARLLKAFQEADPIPLIAEEAAEWAGISPRSCYWKRCSELREEGLITFIDINGVPYEKKSSVGEWCKASVITPAGMRVASQL